MRRVSTEPNEYPPLTRAGVTRDPIPMFWHICDENG